MPPILRDRSLEDEWKFTEPPIGWDRRIFETKKVDPLSFDVDDLCLPLTGASFSPSLSPPYHVPCRCEPEPVTMEEDDESLLDSGAFDGMEVDE